MLGNTSSLVQGQRMPKLSISKKRSSREDGLNKMMVSQPRCSIQPLMKFFSPGHGCDCEVAHKYKGPLSTASTLNLLPKLLPTVTVSGRDMS